MSALQGAHFFSRVPRSESAVTAPRSAYVLLDAATGHYVLSDSRVLGAVEAFFVPDDDGNIRLNDDPTGARTAALYGTSTVQL